MRMWVKSAGNLAQEKGGGRVSRDSHVHCGASCGGDAADGLQGSMGAVQPGTVEIFSATTYFFDRELHQKLGVPVGLIAASVGATPIETWISLDKQEGKRNSIRCSRSRPRPRPRNEREFDCEHENDEEDDPFELKSDHNRGLWFIKQDTYGQWVAGQPTNFTMIPESVIKLVPSRARRPW